jgi:hypothetical protein
MHKCFAETGSLADLAPKTPTQMPEVKPPKEEESELEAFRHYCIETVLRSHQFIGRHRPDMEKPHWHYYERMNGTFLHFRKEWLVSVSEGELFDNTPHKPVFANN